MCVCVCVCVCVCRYLPEMREPLQGKANYAIRVANGDVPWLTWGDRGREPEGGVNVLGQVQLMTTVHRA